MPDALARAEALFGRYRSRGVLLDANLLVLYVLGSHDARLISSAKATRSRGFETRDYAFIAKLVDYMGTLYATPHVLTEVNSLSNTSISAKQRWDFFSTFRGQVERIEEIHVASQEAALDDVFLRLGLTDAAILAGAADGPLVVSTDPDLCVSLEGRGLGVVNYTPIQVALALK